MNYKEFKEWEDDLPWEGHVNPSVDGSYDGPLDDLLTAALSMLGGSALVIDSQDERVKPGMLDNAEVFFDKTGSDWETSILCVIDRGGKRRIRISLRSDKGSDKVWLKSNVKK